MLNGKDIIIHLIVGSSKNVKRYYKMSQYYPPYKSSSNNIKVELDGFKKYCSC